MKVVYPWPPKELSPNARKHWAKKMPIKNKYMLTCKLLTYSANIKPFPKKVYVPLKIDFYPQTDRFDLDNCLASIKSLLDGLSQAIGVNDKRFRPITLNIPETDKTNPRVEITLIFK